jgi:hypothetical protein
MRIGLVAIGAFAGQSEISAVQIFYGNVSRVGRRNMRGLVALSAGGCSMFSLKPIARSGMIELLNWNAPMDQIEILSVVFHMASGTASLSLVRPDK